MKSNWAKKTIGDLCNIEYGTRVVNKKDGGEKYYVYGGGGATFRVNDFNRENRVIIARFAMSKKCTRFVSGRFFLNDSGLTLSPKDPDLICQDYLDLQSLYLNDKIYSLGKGSAQRNLNVTALRNLKISFPESIRDQKNAAGRIREIFKEIESDIESSEKCVRHSHDLFLNTLDSLLTKAEPSWQRTLLGNEVNLGVGFAFKSSGYTDSESGIKLLRGDNIIPERLRWEGAKKWPVSDFDNYAQYQLRVGDVVLAMDRPIIKSGLKHAILSEDDIPSLLVQRTARLRSKGALDNSFLMYLVGSRLFTDHVIGIQTGSGVPHISAKEINNFTFLLPPLSRQEELVQKLDGIKFSCRSVESFYQQKLTLLEELKKSILHKAFSGEL